MRESRSLLSLLLLVAYHTGGAFVPSHNAAGFSLQPVLSAPSRTTSVKWGLVAKSPTAKPTANALSMASKSEEPEPSWAFNPLFAALWLGFFAFAAFGPGEFLAASDTALITDYIANPSDPGFSEGFQLIFNYLGIMPINIACTAVPQAAKRGLPPLPFLVSSFAMGYGGVGPYLSFRAPPKDEYNPSDASWFTRNVLENKLLGWGLVAGL